jgi:hypothetical protein
VREVLRLATLGISVAEVARRSGIPRSTVREWLRLGEAGTDGSVRAMRTHNADNCALRIAVDPEAYAYLLGQYLGDGHISGMRRGVQRLRITTSDQHPGIRAECEAAIATVMPHNKVGFARKIGCTDVWCYSKHWVCLFPQHGPGHKHHRRIELESWQTAIAIERHVRPFVRGLIHSDGWRGTNRVRNANGRHYAYSRYLFSNRSGDIRELFVAACEQLGVRTRRMNAWTISVADRASVGLLDQFVGLKY